MDNPKLSIITINLNNASGLRKTIESVISQTFSDFEYIIIDGGSTDVSVDVINEYSDKITYWVSEPDKGIYNAMNKGILKASGDYCLFLNSGDYLFDERVVEDFQNIKQDEDIICGNITYFESEKNIIIYTPSKENLSFLTFYNNSLPHQASFIKRELFSQFGLYIEALKINSDKDFFLRTLVTNNRSYYHFDRIISIFDKTGISSQDSWLHILLKEDDEVIQSHISPLIYKSLKFLIEENLKMHSLYEEYINLKNGKFRLIIEFLLWIKKLVKP